jgi:hypothetical protein
VGREAYIIHIRMMIEVSDETYLNPARMKLNEIRTNLDTKEVSIHTGSLQLPLLSSNFAPLPSYIDTPAACDIQTHSG